MNTPLTDEQLAEIEAREQKATPGPWGVGNGESIGLGIEQTSPASFSCDAILANVTIDEDRETDVWVARDPSRVSPVTVEVCPAEDDAEFIAHARQDVPALLAEVRRLRDQIAAVEKFCAARAEYITAINGCPPGNSVDYWRWQGHAEGRRHLSKELGLPVAWPTEYGQAEQVTP